MHSTHGVSGPLLFLGGGEDKKIRNGITRKKIKVVMRQKMRNGAWKKDPFFKQLTRASIGKVGTPQR